MCKTHIYTSVAPNGRLYERTEQEFCKRSRHGVICDRDTTYNHEEAYTSRLSPRAAYNYPPTPPRSSHSRGGSDSGSSSKRRSSSYYIEGDRIVDIRKSSPARRSRRNSFAVEFEEPTVLPRRHTSVRHTAPPSPHLNDDLFQVSDPKQLEEMVNGRPVRGILKGSGTRRASRGSHASDEERYLYKGRIDLLTDNQEERDRAARRQKKIDQSNKVINSRPAHVPEVPSVSSSSGSRSYRRGSVVLDPAEVTARMRALDIQDQRRQEKRERRAEEEQQQRLRDRMSPRGADSYYVGSARQDRYY
ncbi:uncharacterized protein B0I36DRAFT_312946 [Microdochium trichocladiopsis]|uniref:Uncharacterized protein n=1 Tax=Microdochium trichocladiopsis TaxID=1682393 RepID=A0A9P8YL30_9PEZI|nr:uncharacterized protein B0I36DRAFT_312946 [Microdochium trichocladiopsis]KAH7041506.1 hypothetical protein B0I36DRAFT_312946 [Microdochium trichocladiopsis]